MKFLSVLLIALVALSFAQEVEQDTPLCGPCQLGVQLVKDYLSKPDQELLAMLLKGCEALPGDLAQVCKMAVTLVGGQMIAYIRTHLRESPRQICANFRLCSATEDIEKQDTPLCGPCQLGVQLVKDFANKPDEELIALLNENCEKLPTDLVAPCKMAVMLVGKQMIAYIRTHLRESPRLICSKFRLCSPTFAIEAEQKNKIQCVLKCLGSGWNVERVLKLLAKCRTNKSCYLKEVGQVAAECIMKCF